MEDAYWQQAHSGRRTSFVYFKAQENTRVARGKGSKKKKKDKYKTVRSNVLVPGQQNGRDRRNSVKSEFLPERSLNPGETNDEFVIDMDVVKRSLQRDFEQD